MSWREVLGVANFTETSQAQNTHNAHKSPGPDNSADFANSAQRGAEQRTTKEPAAKNRLAPRLQAAAEARGLTVAELLVLADPDDLPLIAEDPSLARYLAARLMREKGKRPATYTQPSQCQQCGPVWLEPGSTTPTPSCPWCFNRLRGLPTPRPDDSRRQDSAAQAG